MIKNVTILGAGNGGFAAAADLTLRGFKVKLYENEKFSENIAEIQGNKKIEVLGAGPKGTALLQDVTTDLKSALCDADIILPISPAYAQENVAQSLLPYLTPGMKFILTPGSTGGALVYAKIFHEAGKLEGIKIAEMHTLPYATRKVNGHKVKILLEVRLLLFAAFPSTDNEEMFALAKELYPHVELVTNVLESSLNNGNAVSHPAPVVLNAGKIEYYKKHYHYKEGITPSVARVNERIDQERLEISKKFGFKELGAIERNYRMGYTNLTDNLYDAYQSSKHIYCDIEGPNDLSGRYLTEDAPCSLVAMSEIGKLVGVHCPTMNAVIQLGSILRNENYFETGRTLEKMGIAHMNLETLHDFLTYGYPEQRNNG